MAIFQIYSNLLRIKLLIDDLKFESFSEDSKQQRTKEKETKKNKNKTENKNKKRHPY